MRELLKMIIVVSVICAFSGLVLSFTNQATLAQREIQLLTYVQGPSIQAALMGQDYDNDPIQDRFPLDLGKDDRGDPLTITVFPARKAGQLVAFSYASSGMGYGGEIDVMVGFDVDGRLSGIGIMTHAETPGLGARIQEAGFTGQFRGLDSRDGVRTTQEGGRISSISGATISSRGVAAAVDKAASLFPRVKEEVS